MSAVRVQGRGRPPRRRHALRPTSSRREWFVVVLAVAVAVVLVLALVAATGAGVPMVEAVRATWDGIVGVLTP